MPLAISSFLVDGIIRTAFRNETGSSIPKGTLIAITGFSVSENRLTVVVADKDDSAKRPAVAVTEAAVANNTNFEGIILGVLTGLNTSSFSVNDQLVLGAAGAVSRPPPETDPFTGEIQLVGSVGRVDASNGSIDFKISGLLPMTAAHFFAAREISPTGNVSGGEVTRVSGLNVAVAAGSGFVNNGTDVFRVPFSAVSSLALTANATNFIFVDKNQVVQASTSPPALGNNIVLADAITNASSVLLLANHQVLLTERPAIFHDYAKDVVGNIVVSGVITAKDAIALRLEVEAGTFYTRDFKVTVPATDPITFTYWFRDGSGGFTQVTGQTLIDKDNFDDGSGTLAALVATEFKKDLLFVIFTASGAVEYHVFYGQEKFTSQSGAEGGNLPAADSDVIANGVQSGGIVIEGASATIASVVDVRPFIGQLGPGTTAVTDHGLLSGLGDAEDHLYAALLDGTRPYTGDQDLGGNAITNVGNVDGVDVSGHAARHLSGGADPIVRTKRFPIRRLTPQSSANAGNSFFNVIGLADYDSGHHEFVKDVDGKFFGIVEVPTNIAATPNAKIVLLIRANATSGVTRLQVGTKAVADGESTDPTLTDETAQNITVPGTARLRKDVTFTLTDAPAADDILIVEIFHNGDAAAGGAADTLAVNTELFDAYLEIDVT